MGYDAAPPAAATTITLRPLQLLAPFCLLALCACRGEDPPPNIILISLDTLRADHLSCYGYGKDTSPRLDAFAAGATRYTACRATAPWTVPTHASLFTGLHPFEHGAHSFDITVLADNVHPLDDAAPTLAQVLAGGGYRTGAIVANQVYLAPEFGLDRGFDDYELSRVRAPELSARAATWIDAGDGPFFLFLNYLDTHRPYNIAGSDGSEDSAPSEHPSVLLDQLHEQVMVEGRAPEAELLAQVIEQYDRSISNLDAGLGQLFTSLADRGLLANSWIIVTSDHGEYFGEHGLVEHSKDVYEEALAVPLIVRAPGQVQGEVVSAPISSVDIPRLILGGALPAHSAHWEVLFPHALGNHDVLAQNYFSRPIDLLHPTIGPRLRRVRTVLYGDGYKFIHSSDGLHELFDLGADPRESNNLYGQDAERDAELRGEVQALLAGPRAHAPSNAEPRELDPERLEAMRALGYLEF